MKFTGSGGVILWGYREEGSPGHGANDGGKHVAMRAWIGVYVKFVDRGCVEIVWETTICKYSSDDVTLRKRGIHVHHV